MTGVNIEEAFMEVTKAITEMVEKGNENKQQKQDKKINRKTHLNLVFRVIFIFLE